ncbi:MAG: hypothetical protein ABL925_10315, partial [Methylococcales bacterium]
MNSRQKLGMAIFLLTVCWCVSAQQNSLYEQRVEHAVPDQEALAHSAEKIREHKDVKIQEKPIIQAFHKQLGELETAPKTFCRTCHGPLPHKKQLRTRTFNNMHVRFIACETCHFRPKDQSFAYRWFDYELDQTVDGKGLFRVTQKIDNAKQRPNNPKIAPLHLGQRVFALKDEAFAKSIAEQWQKADDPAKVKLRAKIHWPLEKKGPACHDCHDEKKSLFDLSALGATAEEKQAMVKHVIPQFFRRYQKDEQKITIRD